MGPGHRDFKSGTTASLRASERAALVSGHSAAGLRPFPAQDSAHRTLVPTEDADAGGHCPPSSSSHHRVARYSHPHLSSAEGQVPLSVLSVEEQRRFEARDLPGRAIRRDRAVLCFDADCFYAQVEEAREPALRGAPLGVTQKNIIVTCNYAARAEGVTKLMPIGRALARCPGLALRSGEDLTHYRAASARITDCLAGSLAGGGDGEGLSERETEHTLHSPPPPLRLLALSAGADALSELDAAGAVPSPALLERQGLDEVFMDATAPARALLGTDGVQRWRASLRSRCLHEGREMPTTDALASALAPAHSVEWPPGGERARAAARALAARILGASDCGVRARVHAAAAVGCPSEGGVGAWTGSVESDDNGDDAKESEEEEEEGEEDFVEGDDPLLRGRAEAAPQPPAAAARETDSDALLVAADVIAACARRRVRRTLGLTLCAGVGHSKLLAKFAVNMKKPGAQSLLHASAVGPFLLTLPLRRVPGVGGATARRLAGAFGAHAVRDLLPIALPRIAAELGDRAARLVYLAARGIDDTAVTPSQAPRSISVEDSFKVCVSAPPPVTFCPPALMPPPRAHCTEGCRHGQRARVHGGAGGGADGPCPRRQRRTRTCAATLGRAPPARPPALHHTPAALPCRRARGCARTPEGQRGRWLAPAVVGRGCACRRRPGCDGTATR